MLSSYRIRFFLIVCILCLLLASYMLVLAQQKIVEKYHSPITLEDINIYAIHKKDMEKRYPRLQQQLQTYFTNNIVEIIEPVNGDYIRGHLSMLYTSGKLSENGYQDLLYNMMIHAKTKNGALTVSAVSLYLTNLLIMEKEYSSGNQHYMMIIEDDILIRDGFDSRFRSVLHKLPEDWDILYLACHFRGEEKKIGNEKEDDFSIIPMTTRVHGTGAILYHPRALGVLLNTLTPMDLQIDHDIPDKIVLTKKLNAYIALTRDGFPLIHNDNQHYGSSTQTTDG